MRTTSMVTMMLAAAVMLAAVATLHAGKDKDKKGKSPELVSLELAGTVDTEDIEKKGKDGSVKTITIYFLKSNGEHILLPEAKKSKNGEPPAYKLSDFVGAKVNVTAKGFTAPLKKGGTKTHVHSITAIKRVEV